MCVGWQIYALNTIGNVVAEFDILDCNVVLKCSHRIFNIYIPVNVELPCIRLNFTVAKYTFYIIFYILDYFCPSVKFTQMDLNLCKTQIAFWKKIKKDYH